MGTSTHPTSPWDLWGPVLWNVWGSPSPGVQPRRIGGDPAQGRCGELGGSLTMLKDKVWGAGAVRALRRCVLGAAGGVFLLTETSHLCTRIKWGESQPPGSRDGR